MDLLLCLFLFPQMRDGPGLFFRKAAYIMNTVLFDIYVIVNRTHHVFTGGITTGFTVAVLFFTGGLVHAIEDLLGLLFGRFLDGYRFIRIVADEILQFQTGKGSHEIFQPLIRCFVCGPGTLALFPEGLFARALFQFGVAHLGQSQHHIICIALRIGGSTVDAASGAVRDIYHERLLLVLFDPSGIFPEIVISLVLTLYLTDNLFLTQKMFHIFSQAAGHGIERTETVFQIIRDIHVFFHVNGGTHHGAVYGNHPGNQLRNIFFHVSYHSRTGLGNTACEIL